MRVDCDNCGAQYKIPSHKLVKEVNKATCRKCGHRMLIKKAEVPAPASALAAAPAPAPDDTGEENTQITSAAVEPSMSEAQARAVSAFPASPPDINEWEDEQPTKIRSLGTPASDNRPTAPGNELPPTTTSPPEGEPTQILDEPTAPEPIPPQRPRQAAPAPAPIPIASPSPQVAQQTRPRRGYDPSADLTWAIVGSLAAIVGVLLLAANLSGSSIQRFFGLLLSLGGTSATLFILVTGGRGSKKASLLIATLLSLFLSFGGATAINLLHVGYASWSTPEVAGGTPAAPDPEPVTEPDPEPIADAEPDEPEEDAPSAEDLLGSADLTPPTPEPIEEPEPEREVASTPAAAAPAPAPSEPERETSSSSSSSSASSASSSSSSSRPPAEDDNFDDLFADDDPPAEPEEDRSADAVLLPTVVDTILRNNKGVKRCFQYEYKRSGSVPSSLAVGFKVRSSGSVSSAWVNSSSYKGTELESCLKGAIVAVQFPPFDGATKTMSYTFRL